MLTSKHLNAILTEPSDRERSEFMQEERFEVFFQNISGLYRAVQRLRAQFAQMSAGVELGASVLAVSAARVPRRAGGVASGGAVQHRPLARFAAAQAASGARTGQPGGETGKRRYGWKIRLTQEGLHWQRKLPRRRLRFRTTPGAACRRRSWRCFTVFSVR